MSNQRITHKEMVHIVSLLERGMTFEAIIASTGVGKSTIQRAKANLGVKAVTRTCRCGVEFQAFPTSKQASCGPNCPTRRSDISPNKDFSMDCPFERGMVKHEGRDCNDPTFHGGQI